jgi:hypothetical protein
VQGVVTGIHGTPVAGAHVWVVGHKTGQKVTAGDGAFDVSAYAANGQMIQLHVEAGQYKTYEGLQQAGDSEISVALQR